MAPNAPFSTSAPLLESNMGAPYKSMAGKLQQPLLNALDAQGYQQMTPVQEKVLTDLPTFRSDCLVQAKTGTGKTIAFLLPALHSLLSERAAPTGQVVVLIVSPTRELALQIKQECDILTTKLQPRLECHTAFGGTSREKHLREFLNGKPTVLVATPGRLNDYLQDDNIARKFTNLRTLILDEADTMLEAGFLPAINQILTRLPPKSNGWQGMCFSATMPDKMKSVLGRVLGSNYTHITTVDKNEVPTIEKVAQYSIVIPTVGDTFAALYALIQHERQQSPNDFKAIVFGTTANGVAMLYDLFQEIFGRELKVYELHSRLSQNARTRTTEEFRLAPSGLLYASDVVGRGLDFPRVSHVIQVGLPSSGEQYVHRVGRTARAGTEGRAIIMLTDSEKYFLAVNRHLPIQPYPANISSIAAQGAPVIAQALARVDQVTKSKAYQGYLGYHKSFMKQLRLDPVGLVAVANEYAAAMGCSEPPVIDKQVVGKMGLRGTKGLNVGVIDRPPRSNKPHPGNQTARSNGGAKGPDTGNAGRPARHNRPGAKKQQQKPGTQ